MPSSAWVSRGIVPIGVPMRSAGPDSMNGEPGRRHRLQQRLDPVGGIDELPGHAVAGDDRTRGGSWARRGSRRRRGDGGGAGRRRRRRGRGRGRREAAGPRRGSGRRTAGARPARARRSARSRRAARAPPAPRATAEASPPHGRSRLASRRLMLGYAGSGSVHDGFTRQSSGLPSYREIPPQLEIPAHGQRLGDALLRRQRDALKPAAEADVVERSRHPAARSAGSGSGSRAACRPGS